MAHVYPEAESGVLALDVPPSEPTDTTEAQAREMLSRLDTPNVLVLTDVFGATPCNVAKKLVDGLHCKLVAGVNLPMLLRTVNYRHEPLDQLVARALAGGAQCIMQVVATVPQNQARQANDHKHHDYQQ
jgi:PTS system ascorbate-specific IIA component